MGRASEVRGRAARRSGCADGDKRLLLRRIVCLSFGQRAPARLATVRMHCSARACRPQAQCWLPLSIHRQGALQRSAHARRRRQPLSVGGSPCAVAIRACILS
jgi:hypothetical protein